MKLIGLSVESLESRLSVRGSKSHDYSTFAVMNLIKYIHSKLKKY